MPDASRDRTFHEEGRCTTAPPSRVPTPFAGGSTDNVTAVTRADADNQGARLEAASAAPGLAVLIGPRGVGRSTTVAELVGRLGWTRIAGLELLADHRHLLVSRLAGTDLTDADPTTAIDAVREALNSPLVVDDAQDVDDASLEVLAAVAQHRFVTLAWRDEGRPLPAGATIVVRHPPLTEIAAEDLARAHGADDPEALAWRAGGLPGLVLALCGAGDPIEVHRAALAERLMALEGDERRALAVLYAASAVTLRGQRRTWLPTAEAGPVDRLVDAGLVDERAGAAQLAHGMAGELAWHALELDERIEVRKTLARSEDALVAIEQLVALGDEPAAVDRARAAGASAPAFVASRLLSFVADHAGTPDDHEAAANAAARLTDGLAVAHHADALDDAPLHTARAHRLAGRVDRAMAVIGDHAADHIPAIAAERRQLVLRSHDRRGADVAAVPLAVAALAALADLVDGRPPGEAEAGAVAEVARQEGDLDAAVLALAVAAAGSAAGDPDLPGALDRVIALGDATGAPLARQATRLVPVVGFHVGAVGAAITDDLAELPGPTATMHRVLAMALAGRTGDAGALIDDGDWPDTALWDSVRWWLRAENALLAGRLVTCRNAAAEVESCVPPTTATVDLARLAAARADVEEGERVSRFEPASFLAEPVRAELAALTADDRERAAAHRAASAAWTGRHHPAALRCRIAAAIAELPEPSALAALQRATDEADALGFLAVAAAGRRAMRRAGASSGPSAADASGLLSPREREVLGHVAEGSSSREIANLLGVAPSTVDTQVKSAMQKLGARTRRQAAALMLADAPVEVG